MCFKNYNEVWLSLVEHYVRDVGAAGSNPVTSTEKSGVKYTGFFYLLRYLKSLIDSNESSSNA